MSSVAQRPHRVLMVTGVYPTQERPYKGTYIKSQVESLRAAGLEVEVIHPKPSHWTPFRYCSATFQVFRKTLRGHFDIVHGHYGLWCLATRLQWTTPVVASFMGDDLLGSPLADGGWSKKAALVTRISRWLCRRMDAVIVKSEGMKNRAAGNRIFVVPNGVDFSFFHPIPRTHARRALGWDEHRPSILFVNNPQEPKKGFLLAEASIERLRAQGVEAELVIANRLPQTQVVQFINACNALLLPSIHEGSPNIVKEAMACNVPVVATDVGDVAQVVGGTTGCHVCPRDPDALATALKEALLLTEPTTGRADIAHLECSVVAMQVIYVYEQAAQHAALRRRSRQTKRPRTLASG
jgi:teichuronic acid biosynthesis glycosyltransferase TuaC